MEIQNPSISKGIPVLKSVINKVINRTGVGNYITEYVVPAGHFADISVISTTATNGGGLVISESEGAASVIQSVHTDKFNASLAAGMAIKYWSIGSGTLKALITIKEYKI